MNTLFIIRIIEKIFSDILKSSKMSEIYYSHNIHYVSKKQSYENG
jgi:hypothetical protein